MKYLMKMYERRILENILEDEILDKMLDKGITFNNLSDEDKHILQHGKEHPNVEYENKRKNDKYVSIKNVLEFIYDEHSVTGRDMNDLTVSVDGTVIYNDDEYEGRVTISTNKIDISFFNIKGEEFDPRNNIKHMDAFEKTIKNVLEDKIVIQGRNPNEESDE